MSWTVNAFDVPPDGDRLAMAHNKRINASHSVVAALAHGRKRRAVGRARYALR